MDSQIIRLSQRRQNTHHGYGIVVHGKRILVITISGGTEGSQTGNANERSTKKRIIKVIHMCERE